MPDVVVRIYLYLLIISSIIFSVVWVIIWLVKPERRRSPVRTKNLIRDFFFLVTGLVGFYIFSGRFLNNWLIMALMSVMLIASGSPNYCRNVCKTTAPHNKSLDASGGSVFLN